MIYPPKLQHRIPMRIVLLLFFIFSTGIASAALKTTVAPGSWNIAATWGGTLPVTGDDIIIMHNVDVNLNTPVVGNLTVNAGCILTVLNAASVTLSIDGTITVNGTLINNGKVDLVNPNPFILNGTYTHNPRANVSTDESIFENGIESFAPTSNLNILKWNDYSIPLCSPIRVNGNLGNVTLSVAGSWDQDGTLAGPTSKIKGSLTITAGEIVFDDGTGNSTNLILNDVTVTGTANVIFQTGVSRNLNLTTGNYTDNSTSSALSRIMTISFGTLTWTVNGSLNLGHKTFFVEGTASENGSATINVTGDFVMNTDTVSILRQVTGNLNLNVTGNTSITGNPAYIRFLEGNTGNMIFNTANFLVSGGNNNVLVGGNAAIPAPTGNVTVNIGTDFLVSGTSNTTILNSDININKCKITVGRHCNISNSNAFLRVANSNGDVYFGTGADLIVNPGNYTSQDFPGNVKSDSIMVGGNFLFNSATAANYFIGNKGAATAGGTVFRTNGNFTLTTSGTANGQGVYGVYQANSPLEFFVGGAYLQNGGRFNGIYNGDGSMVCTVGGLFTMNDGIFRGIHNLQSIQAGTINFTADAIDYNKGQFSALFASTITPQFNNFNVTNNCDINFNSVQDTFTVIGVEIVEPGSNESKLNFNVGGSLILGGANGTFISSKAKGREVVAIGGNMNISGGMNSFNSSLLLTYPNGHPVIMTITGNVNVSGGTSYISARADTIVCTVSGDVNVTNGTLALKGGSGSAVLNINGGYFQSGGTFLIHNSTTIANTFQATMTVNADGNATGDFVHSAGTFNFDNDASTSSIPPILNIKSPSYTLGPSGTMTKASNSAFGLINYARTGTTTYSRNNGHLIQEIKQKILGGTTVDVASGNMQIGSYTLGVSGNDFLTVDNGSVLDLRGNKVVSNAQYDSTGILVLAGRVRIQHPNGLFNATNNAAFDATGNLNYYLLPTSTVEYYGTATQIVSGWNLGIAVKSQHQYGNLEINFQGPANTSWVYPTSLPNINSVIVRTSLILTAGELNLDDDHLPSAGGKNIIIRSSSATPIIRTNGYIRSESYNGLGNVIWRNTSGTTPSLTIPFAKDATPANYIPFTIVPTAGKIDSLTVSTYGTPLADNIPYPPSVLHVNNLGGANNSAQTVDRFWYINATGTISGANVTFKCTPTEAAGVTNPRAQRWVPLSLGWALPVGTQSTIATGTQANTQTIFNAWWTLSALLNPLPVELASFDASCENGKMDINWVTASELNNNFFTVERSGDGTSFEPIATVKGAGNSSVMLNYSIRDLNPLSGINYYRLKQTDMNGDFKYSDVISKYKCEGGVPVKIYSYVENSAQQIQLVMDAQANEKARISVYDLSGRIIYSEEVSIADGFNKFTIPTNQLASGMYMLNMEGDITHYSSKVIIGRP